MHFSNILHKGILLPDSHAVLQSVVHASWWMIVKSWLFVLFCFFVFFLCGMAGHWSHQTVVQVGTFLSLSLCLSAVLASDQFVASCSLPLQHAVHVLWLVLATAVSTTLISINSTNEVNLTFINKIVFKSRPATFSAPVCCLPPTQVPVCYLFKSAVN